VESKTILVVFRLDHGNFIFNFVSIEIDGIDVEFIIKFSGNSYMTIVIGSIDESDSDL